MHLHNAKHISLKHAREIELLSFKYELTVPLMAEIFL